jgi:lipoprotein LpqS
MPASTKGPGYVARQHLSLSAYSGLRPVHSRWLPRRRNPITRRRRLAAWQNGFRSAATVGNIVRYNEAVSGARVRATTALALAFWVVVVATEWALPVTDVTPAHGHHALSSALPTGHALVTEHPHVSDASTPLAPDTFAEAVLPRTSTTLVALGLIAAVAAVVLLWHQTTLAAVRGPPRPLPTVLSGRVILTRLCIARR